MVMGERGGGHIIQATPQSVSKVLRMAWAGHPSPALYAEGRYWLRNLPEMKIYLQRGHLSIWDEFTEVVTWESMME